jgi:hypothetical protein
MKFKIVPVCKTDPDIDPDLYEATGMLVSYFNENPDEPFVKLVMEDEGKVIASGKINNPRFDEMIESVHIAVHRYKTITARRTVMTRNSTNEKWPEED